MAATIKHIDINGLDIPVIFEKDKRLPIANMQFVFTNAGSIQNTDIAGLARFSAKVMNEGTKKLGSSAFAEALEAKAIGISSSTGTETFVMEISSLKEEFDEALKYFHMLLQDPNLTQQAIQKVKTTTIGSLTAKMNDFDYIASNALKSILFEKTPLAKPSLGTIESIESIKLKDVEKFIQTNLVSSKLIVVLGGDIDLATPGNDPDRQIGGFRWNDINGNGDIDPDEAEMEPTDAAPDDAAWGKYNEFGQKEVGSGSARTIQNELDKLVHNIGMEYWYSSYFALRMGYLYDKTGKISNPTFGVGLRFAGYGFDFGYTSGEPGHPLANTMRFSLNIEF
jgi:hypothetical protein